MASRLIHRASVGTTSSSPSAIKRSTSKGERRSSALPEVKVAEEPAPEVSIGLGRRHTIGQLPADNDASSQRWALAKSHRLPPHEVLRIIQDLDTIQKDPEVSLTQKEFSTWVCKVFDVRSIQEEVAQSAIAAAWVPDMLQKTMIDKFLGWYVQNMFRTVTGLTADEDSANSDALIYGISKKHNVSTSVIDKIKKDFDRVDGDSSGLIDPEEFNVMIHLMLKAKNGDISADRLSRFWKDIDRDGNGTVDFDEYAEWYLKCFGSEGEGLAQSLYDGYSPDTQRTKLLESSN